MTDATSPATTCWAAHARKGRSGRWVPSARGGYNPAIVLPGDPKAIDVMTDAYRWQDLAVLGGPPRFREKLHVGLPNLPAREPLLRRLDEVFQRRRLTNHGPHVGELERRITELLGVRHCIAVANGTTALSLAIRGVGWTGEVIVPSLTFVGTAHALQWEGITPVFCDAGLSTHNIDPRKIAELVSERTTGILAVHLWGRPCAIEAIEAIAREHRLSVVYDAAHAFLCSHGGRMIGGFGAAEAFSFHATKFFHTVEGGAVTTDDDELAKRIRRMRDFGFSDSDEVVGLGINGKLNELCAAVGLGLLDEIDAIVETNRLHHHTYRDALAGAPGLRLCAFDERERNNYQFVVVEVDADAAGIDRDGLLRVLEAENVLARRYFHPGCHRMEPYRSLSPSAGRRLEGTEELCDRVLCLPTGTGIDADAIRGVCGILRTAVAHAERVRGQLWSLPLVPSGGSDA
jgi:dTDP-4-amino-4,6-dideoxygalactose transaminase